MYAAIGYTAALIAAHYMLPDTWLLWFALGSALLSLTGLFFRGKSRLIVLIVLLSAALGFIWTWGHDTLFIKPAEELIGSTQQVEARVIDYPNIDDDYSSVMLRLEEDGMPSARVLVVDYNGAFSDINVGDIIKIDLKFRSAA